ncbi:type VI secretion system protein TssL [Natronospirillum operosum]|uniref:Type VI secretion system protein TssL n=1 Tax=Natronospirillum operosum TaxID=2759953 RepID=A0A4Z0W8U8_9GAMM|nr:MotB family protein [Natronospirillum operosum]TGG90368.1 type VI secretion system protein TssL [Natronospirillum operosum]
MSDEDQEHKREKKGLPPWMATFADLMALLLSFFVLLLSFSEIEALRFQRLAGSLRNAFGVQQDVPADAIPRGTSIIAQEFSPGRPDPTPLNVVRQDTIRDLEDSLEVLAQDEIQQQEDRQGDRGELTRDIVVTEQMIEEAQEEAAEIAGRLGDYIDQGALQIETLNETIVIRVREQSFPSGSDFIADEFLPILDRVREVLLTTPGDIRVEGHTDSVPIASGPFRNNWELSTARALSIGEYLWAAPEMEENRFTVVGHGASKPIATNETPEGRATNRRVEIIIQRDNPDFEGERIPLDAQGEPVDFGDPGLFGLDPDQVF